MPRFDASAGHSFEQPYPASGVGGTSGSAGEGGKGEYLNHGTTGEGDQGGEMLPSGTFVRGRDPGKGVGLSPGIPAGARRVELVAGGALLSSQGRSCQTSVEIAGLRGVANGLSPMSVGATGIEKSGGQAGGIRESGGQTACRGRAMDFSLHADAESGTGARYLDGNPSVLGPTGDTRAPWWYGTNGGFSLEPKLREGEGASESTALGNLQLPEGVAAAEDGQLVSGAADMSLGTSSRGFGVSERVPSAVGAGGGTSYSASVPTGARRTKTQKEPSDCTVFRVAGSGARIDSKPVVGSPTSHSIEAAHEVVYTVQPNSISPLVGIKVHGIQVVALCDTGACVSLIRSRLWAQVGGANGSLLPCRMQLVTAAGEQLKPLGVASVVVDIAGTLRRVEMRVVPRLQFDVLPGYPALKAFGASVDALADKLRLAGGKEVDVIRGSSGPLVRPVRLVAVEGGSHESEPAPADLQVLCRADLPLPDADLALVFVPPEDWSLTGPEVVELSEGSGVFTISVPISGAVFGPLWSAGQFGALELEAHRVGADPPAAVLALLPDVVEPEAPQWWTLCDDASWECSTPQRQQVIDMLSSFPSVGSRGPGDIGCTSLARCIIDTGDARPIKQRFRRTSPRASVEIKAEIEALLSAGVIRPSQSPWASPVVTVRKKDGSLRMCIDYRALNEVTRKDAYPLPDIDQVLERLGGSEYFCTLDLVSGYFQMEMEPDSIPKTAFTTEHGHFEYLRAPFGLATMPSQFQRMVQGHIDDPLHGIQCFLDDIIVHGASFDVTLTRLRRVLERLQAAGLKLKPSKCEFFRKQVCFLGHVVSRAGIAPDPSKVASVEQWPVPGSVAELRSFLGLVNYYRRMIPSFAEVASPLYALFKKGVVWAWSPACQQSFDTLRKCLVDAPLLAYPEFGPDAGRFILDTDASDVSIGAVLSQVQAGHERVICYGHKLLSPSQRNYCTTQRELLALVYFLDKYQRYLEGSDTLVRVDHSALKWLRRSSSGNSMLQRWSSILEDCGVDAPNGDLLGYLESFRYSVEYRPGVKHGNADALSRRPVPKRNHETCPSCAPEAAAAAEAAEIVNSSVSREMGICAVAPAGPVTAEDGLQTLWRWQSADVAIAAITRRLREGGDRLSRSLAEGWSARQLGLLAQWDALTLNEDQLLCRLSKAGVSQIVIPDALVGDVLKLNHDSPGVNHEGIAKTYARIRRRYYWPLMFRDIEQYVRACEVCLRGKTGSCLARPPLATWDVGRLFSRLHVDFAGPLAPTARGNQYILVLVDAFSGVAVFVATRDCRADTTVLSIVHHWVCHYGLPESIHSDRGTNFESDLLHRVCATFGVRKTRTTAYHPQGNGRAEEMVRQCKQHLFLHLDQSPKDWDLALPFVTYSVRSGVSSSTGMSPFEVMTGQEMRTPSDAAIPVAPELGVVDRSTLGQLSVHLRAVRGRARESLEAARDRQKFYHDRNSRPSPISAGDMVWVRNSANPKHRAKFTGPFRVLQMGLHTAVLFDPETSAENSVSVGRLKREAPLPDELLPRFELWQNPQTLSGSQVDRRAPEPDAQRDDLLSTAPDVRRPGRARPPPAVYTTERHLDPLALWVGSRVPGRSCARTPTLDPVAEIPAPAPESTFCEARPVVPPSPLPRVVCSPAPGAGKSAPFAEEFLLPELPSGERHVVDLDFTTLDRGLELPPDGVSLPRVSFDASMDVSVSEFAAETSQPARHAASTGPASSACSFDASMDVPLALPAASADVASSPPAVSTAAASPTSTSLSSAPLRRSSRTRRSPSRLSYPALGSPR